ncbi:methyl-accepting chemotaxis protein [Cohnella cholangitidis]|uniref:Methyl-accepting chemotaxis protein n=1 Tax=Cohnella cholangitidis TaxID=2598458 RepID=A0A7G5C2U8_9BACL|nr:methyl-accepting chemotaxis protein [Cohnella cholangitidis]QMV43532.1 methyl-accepting chemotaxis protein [Cohnella cholangitidis]
MGVVFLNRKIKLNLTFKFIAVLVVFLGGVFAVMVQLNLNNLKSESVGKGEFEAKSAGQDYGLSFRKTLVGFQHELEMLSLVLRNAKESGSFSREEVVALLQQMLEANPQIVGTYTLWEPNAFDGKDADYVNKTPYDDKTGRLIPYVVRSGEKIVVEPLKNYETPGDGDFYLLPKKNKKVTLMEPYSYEIEGKAVQLTSLIVPIIDNEEHFLGMVGVDFALDSLQEDATKYTPLGGYVTIVSGHGNYVANAAHPDLISKPYGEQEDKAKLFASVIAGETTQGYTNDENGDTVLRMFMPIRLDGSDDVMYAETVIPKDKIMESYNKGRTVTQIISLGALIVLGLVLAFAIRRLIIRHLLVLVRSMKSMAEGDLTQKVEVRSKDEFGELAKDYNHMTGELRGMFHLVHDLSMSVGATSEQLTASAEQTSQASETIARSIEQVASGSTTQNRYVNETATAMSEMSAGIQRIADSTSAVSASAQEVQSQTELGNSRLREAGEQMERVRNTVTEAERVMDQLGERSKEIGGIVDLISRISYQTNLLALNAAIEAARAGEHGRGFVVVAAEIRKLADQTFKATEQITGLIQVVQDETANATKMMKLGTAEVRSGEQHVVECSALFRAVADEMLRVGEQIQEVSATSEQMNASSEQVSASIGELARLAEEASDNSQNVAAASEEQLASMEEISSSSAALSHMVQELMEKLSRFKI